MSGVRFLVPRVRLHFARWCTAAVVFSLVVTEPSMKVASAQDDTGTQTSFTTHYIGMDDSTTSTSAGDLNNDGALDIVVGNDEQPNLIYFNDKSAGFPTATPFGGASKTTTIALGDLNND